MAQQEITLSLPESIIAQLKTAAQATDQPLSAIIAHALKVGGPPNWEDAPARFQPDLAKLNQFNDDWLWEIARRQQNEGDFERYEQLLEKNSERFLTDAEKRELEALRDQADIFMLRKAHAAALLKWRGHILPPPEKL